MCLAKVNAGSHYQTCFFASGLAVDIISSLMLALFVLGKNACPSAHALHIQPAYHANFFHALLAYLLMREQILLASLLMLGK